ncbi:predicted protein [Lichtheimia corymbifera JMRC:FSU:9682]|uniref:Uncharacterized protein n=1 Tax=Lichtheimia corymbifera JMRC:FSU:9682 TaxID=1263082 RepID=A0A068RP19_9FUNG|nr:predicted protein [Lichtheimia corymbifera JMRC:FSU:9682]
MHSKDSEGSYSERVLIIYSGIRLDCPEDFDQTRFSSGDESIINAAKKLTDMLRQKRKYRMLQTLHSNKINLLEGGSRLMASVLPT